MVEYDTYRRKADFTEIDPGKEKEMFTAIRSSFLYLESIENAPLGHEEERGVCFVCSDKNKLGINSMVKDAVLS